MKAIWNGAVIAESDSTINIEGNQYFPPASIRSEYLEKSQTQTTCAWKGVASYYHINVDGKKNADAAWYYPKIKPAAAPIEGYIAFWRGVEVKP
jgi:uncharacterized protein (DUF427 family)